VTGADDDDLLHLEGGELPLAAASPAVPAPEALRPAYAELLARLADGPERHALATALDELRQATDRTREAQQRDARGRARARRRALLAAGALALLLAVGGGLGLRALDGRLQRLAAEDAQRDGQARAQLDEALDRVRAEQAAALAALSGRLDGQQAALESRLHGTEAERDAAQASLALARAQAQELQARADEAARREAEALVEARRERDLRLESLGDGARLRQQLIEKEQDLEALTRTLAELQVARVPAPAPAIVPSAAAAAGLAARVTSALRASGVPDESVVEASGPLDGALLDVLLLSAGPDGTPSRVRRARRADLAVSAGRPVLRLEEVSDATGQALPDELVPLPGLDRAAWERLGLAMPGGAVSLERLVRALDGLLQPHGWKTVALQGFADGALLGLELEQRDGEGRLLRGLHAASGRLLPGPLLELRDGTLSVGGDERAFFQDVYRLPLPAGDLAGWQAALAELGP
jgi:hypothetical protein